MNKHVNRFYRKFVDEDVPIRLYHEVISLHESPLSWEEASKKSNDLPKGWFELSMLNSRDRIDFTKEFWLSALPYVPHIHRFLNSFFAKLDDVGIYLTQLRFDSPFDCEMVYSLRDDSCFFHGLPPCNAERVERLAEQFDGLIPEDFLAFLKIHDGFSKHTDTGLIKMKNLMPTYRQLQMGMVDESQEIICRNEAVDPKDLIPFYESFGEPSYQCFYALWVPGESAGNVYYSSMEKIISDFHDRNTWLENLAFPTFLDWLVFYLEGIET